MKFSKPDFYFPTKDEAADFLETYARHFILPVQYGVKVDELSRNEKSYRLSADGTSIHARNVIIATRAFHTPRIPSYAQKLNPDIFQMHSVAYCNPGQIPAHNILVVGTGNSGAEISIELAKTGRKVWLAGRDVGRIRANRLGKIFGGRPYWWFLRRVMTINTPLGRRMKAVVLTHGNPLVRTQREEVADAGVEFTPRLADASKGKPSTESGQELPAEG